MKLLKILTCIFLVAYATCQNQTETDSDLSESTIAEDDFSVISSSHTEDYTSNPDASNSPSSETSSSEGSTHEETTPYSDLDDNNDTIITLTTPSDAWIITDENVSSTVYGDDTTITSTVTVDDISETNKSACYENPCRNGGTCKEDFSVPPFSCECPTGFVGIHCETVDNCVYDSLGRPCKKGFCSTTEDGLERFCECFVGDYWDNVTSECKEITSVCDSSPCENGGLCSVLSDNKYNCTCEMGFSGKTCEITEWCVKDEDCGHGVCTLSGDTKVRSCKCDGGFFLDEQLHNCKELATPCDSNPCENGGVCNAFDGKYNCTCDIGYSGETCEVTDRCVTNEDCGQGTCVLSEEKKVRSCKCNDGYYLEVHACKKISNVCQPNPCLHGICTVVSVNDYNCTCSEGYLGKKCDIRDMCMLDGGNAFCRQSSCVNNYDLGIYFCTCLDEEYFQYAERRCVALDLCPLVQCEATKKCMFGTCVCKDDYEWNNDTGRCESNFCSRHQCPISDMICEEGTGGTDYKCSCPYGHSFNGTHCNEASCVFPHLNPCKQLCSVTESGYECSCDEDFRLKEDNQTCELIGNNTCSNKTCDKGSCVMKSDTEVCICPPGYIEVDGNCKDICTVAEIAPGLCPSNECEMAPEGGFRCKCEGKFALSKDKTTCVVRNMCQENEIGWRECKEKNAECEQNWNLNKGFKCRCTTGQIETEDGTCRDLCSIESNQRICSVKGATCDADKRGNIKCRCPPYFQANENDGKCNRPADVSYLVTLPLDQSTYERGNRKQRSLDMPVDYQKISRDVKITIETMFVGFTRSTVLYCNTISGYILCKVELQFQFDYKTQLKRLETEDICLTNENSKKCLLPPALVLVKERISQDIVIQPTDPCDEYIKEELCGSETSCTSSLHYKSFNCSCKSGFMMTKKNYPFGNDKSYIESCKDIDECLELDSCPPNSNCLNTIGSYVCTCKNGYRDITDSAGANDQKCVEICHPNPCTHGLCSRRGDHDFDCKCDPGYRGAFCDLQDENFKRARVNTIIVGVVLGGILLITFILFAVCVSRLRKRKCLENPGHMFYNSTEMKERGRINNAFQRE